MGLFGFGKKKEPANQWNTGAGTMSQAEILFLQSKAGTHTLEKIFDYLEADGLTGNAYLERWEEAMRLAKRRAEESQMGDVLATAIYFFVMDMAIHRQELAQRTPAQREAFLNDVFENHGKRRNVKYYLMNYARRRGQMQEYFAEIGKRSGSYRCLISADTILSYCKEKNKQAMAWKKGAAETWRQEEEYDKNRRAGDLMQVLDEMVEFSTKQYV